MIEKFAKPAVCAIIEKVIDGVPCILIQERQKQEGGVENGKLEIPGGKIREYENIFEALRREVREETGLKLIKIHGEELSQEIQVSGHATVSFTPFCTTQNLSGAYSLLAHIFIAEAEGELLEETEETQSIRWEPIEKIKQRLEENPDQFFLMEVSALMKYIQLKLG